MPLDLNRFFKRLFSPDEDNAKIGNTEPICPYCEEQLSKMPSRKSKCPKCNNYFFVRTRPSDNKKVLVTKTQEAQLEEQWAKINGTYEQLMMERKVYADEKSRLTKKFNQEPSDNDIQWSLLKKQYMEYAQAGNWAGYRNVKLETAEFLRKEGKLKIALSTYLEICYIDLNGPRNVSVSPYDVGDKGPNFDPSMSFLAPGLVGGIAKLIKKLSLDEARTTEIFYRIASANHFSLKLPVTPDEAWKILRAELFQN
jgi:DNA-directed RNA polymerase subunit RPC12/RpoP